MLCTALAYSGGLIQGCPNAAEGDTCFCKWHARAAMREVLGTRAHPNLAFAQDALRLAVHAWLQQGGPPAQTQTVSRARDFLAKSRFEDVPILKLKEVPVQQGELHALASAFASPEAADAVASRTPEGARTHFLGLQEATVADLAEAMHVVNFPYLQRRAEPQCES